MSSPITTHVLDLATGKPAAGIGVALERQVGEGKWQALAQGRTDDDGRIRDLLQPGKLEAGFYRLTFDASAYFSQRQVSSFYRSIPIQFHIDNPAQHYHVPLLLSPFGYSTYRGS